MNNNQRYSAHAELAKHSGNIFVAGKATPLTRQDITDEFEQLKADVEYWKACALNGGSLSGKYQDTTPCQTCGKLQPLINLFKKKK